MQNIGDVLKNVDWFGIIAGIIVLETSIKSVAEKRGNTKIVNICDHIGEVLGFIYDVISVLFKKTPPPAVPLIVIALCLFSGCASAGMNSMCAHVNGQELTVPYVGGKSTADAYVCHVGCFGLTCPKPDYDAIATLTAKYLDSVKAEGKLTTTGPGTIEFVPAK